MKKFLALLMVATFLTGCGATGDNSNTTDTNTTAEAAADTNTTAEDTAESTEVTVFIAASLNSVMTELAENYNSEHPNVKINFNPDSSGKLATQIKEGYACDIFFSAAQDKMDDLSTEGLIKEDTRKNVVNNQVVVVALKDSDTAVTGLENIGDAKSIALAGGSVPVGAYTRTALINLGLLKSDSAPKDITTQEVSEALGGVEISEQENVSKVLTAVAEGACEVGTTYYSDTYGYEDKIKVIETVSNDLTGDVIYPVALVENKEADDAQTAAAEDFLNYITSDDAKAVFDKYYFDTNVE
jgi:molybdate transport system substrate-binding protein